VRQHVIMVETINAFITSLCMCTSLGCVFATEGRSDRKTVLAAIHINGRRIIGIMS